MNQVPKDFRPYVKAAVQQGWEFRRRKRHAWLYSPDRVTTVSIPCSPSDHRALKNTICELRRADVQC